MVNLWAAPGTGSTLCAKLESSPKTRIRQLSPATVLRVLRPTLISGNRSDLFEVRRKEKSRAAQGETTPWARSGRRRARREGRR